jgi:hypothetical protein
VAPSHRTLLLLATCPPISCPARSAPGEAALLAGVAVVFVPPILLNADDQLSVARLCGAAGVTAAGGQPRRLLPPESQRAGKFLPPVELLPML